MNLTNILINWGPISLLIVLSVFVYRSYKKWLELEMVVGNLKFRLAKHRQEIDGFYNALSKHGANFEKADQQLLNKLKNESSELEKAMNERFRQSDENFNKLLKEIETIEIDQSIEEDASKLKEAGVSPYFD